MTTTQNYANHAQFVFLYRRVLLPVPGLTLIGSVVNLVESWGDRQRIYSASLILVLTLCGILTALFARIFALKAQDSACSSGLQSREERRLGCAIPGVAEHRVVTSNRNR